MTSLSDLEHGEATGEMRPEPVGFRWYLRSSLPVSWVANEVMPAIRYLRHTERLPVVNLRRGWLHGTHLELIAYSGDGRPVPWTHVLARMRAPEEDPERDVTSAYPHGTSAYPHETSAYPHEMSAYPHGMFEWIASSDLSPWPGQTQSLRERALTRMIDSMAVTLEPGEHVLLGVSAPVDMVAEILLATADAHPLGIVYGTISFRADGEAFLSRSQGVADMRPGSGRNAGPRPEFEQRLAADRPVLRSLVERMLDGNDTPSAASWRRTALYCMGMFDGAILAGSLTAETADEISSQPGVQREDISYRLLLDLLYTQLPLLGVPSQRRYYLCWAIGEIVDEVARTTRRLAPAGGTCRHLRDARRGA
jgi:hypothetical protein